MRRDGKNWLQGGPRKGRRGGAILTGSAAKGTVMVRPHLDPREECDCCEGDCGCGDCERCREGSIQVAGDPIPPPAMGKPVPTRKGKRPGPRPGNAGETTPH